MIFAIVAVVTTTKPQLWGDPNCRSLAGRIVNACSIDTGTSLNRGVELDPGLHVTGWIDAG
jgi:hypothetical protein